MRSILNDPRNAGGGDQAPQLGIMELRNRALCIPPPAAGAVVLVAKSKPPGVPLICGNLDFAACFQAADNGFNQISR